MVTNSYSKEVSSPTACPPGRPDREECAVLHRVRGDSQGFCFRKTNLRVRRCRQHLARTGVGRPEERLWVPGVSYRISTGRCLWCTQTPHHGLEVGCGVWKTKRILLSLAPCERGEKPWSRSWMEADGAVIRTDEDSRGPVLRTECNRELFREETIWKWWRGRGWREEPARLVEMWEFGI